MSAWPNGHIIVIDPAAKKLGRCDCGGMSASNPSHTALGLVTTDSLTAGRIIHGRDPLTGVKL